MKKLLVVSAKLLLSFLGFILLYLLAAYSFSRIPVAEEPNAKEEITIYIRTNGVHTDIVVPTRNEQKDWSKQVKLENTQRADSSFSYLAMGWGDKGFYLETPEWADLKASVAFNAAFGLGSTAIHATYYRKMKEDETCRKILISKEQYERLIRYIDHSFQKDAAGNYLHIKTNANYGKTDAFYEANGSYSFAHTCNTWTNNALKACGQKSCLWTPFDTGIFLHHQ